MKKPHFDSSFFGSLTFAASKSNPVSRCNSCPASERRHQEEGPTAMPSFHKQT